MRYGCHGERHTSSEEILFIISDILFWKFTVVLKRCQVDNLVREEIIGKSLTKKALGKISVRRIILHNLWLDFKCKSNIKRKRFCV